MEKGDVTHDSGYFNCEKLHAKIPKSTCFARQFALFRGSRSFLFPECGSCSQGKVIAKEHQNVLGGEKGKSIMPDQAKSGNEASESKARLCKDCGEKPTISPRSPYCSSCMQKRAVGARALKKTAPGKNKGPQARKKRGEPGERASPKVKEEPKAGINAIRVDFGGHPEVLGATVKLAEEEMRPLDVQIIYMLKSYLKRSGAAL